MRYLIFNITVLVALGYLFTGAPNQSFTQWITNTLDVWSNTSSAGTTIASDGVVESGTAFAKAVAKAASESLEAVDDKLSHSNPLEANVPKIQTSMDADEIKQLIITAMKEAEVERIISKPTKISKTTPPEQVSKAVPSNVSEKKSLPGEMQTALPLAKTTKVRDGVVQNQPAKIPEKMNDAEIAAAFSAFEKIEKGTTENKEQIVFQQENSASSTEQIPTFMSPTQRAEDMSRIIQQLNMLYLEQTGI